MPPLTEFKFVRDEATILTKCWEDVKTNDSIAFRMIDWLMRENAKRRPSASEVLHSKLLPPFLARTSVEHEVQSQLLVLSLVFVARTLPCSRFFCDLTIDRRK